MIRILLIHDAPLLRSALASLVAGEADLEVRTTSWREALDSARSHGADICLVDADYPVASRLSAARDLVQHTGGAPAALVVLAQAGKPGLLRQAVAARARGFVSKDASRERLLEAIRRVFDGERYIDATLAYDFLQAAEIPLTPRELSVLSLAAEGTPLPEIARALHLTRGTVRNYMAAITRKTGARNRVDAIRISQEAGWL